MVAFLTSVTQGEQIATPPKNRQLLIENQKPRKLKNPKPMKKTQTKCSRPRHPLPRQRSHKLRKLKMTTMVERGL